MSSGLGLLDNTISFKENFITRLDPRIKLVFSILFLFVAISTKKPAVPLVILALVIVGMIPLKIKMKFFLVRALPALLIAVTIFVTQVFLYGKTPLFTVNFLGLNVHGYYEGVFRGLTMMSRVLAGMSTVLFLTMSTPLNKLMFAAKWIHAPDAFLEVLTITYRYIFVLFEEMSTVKNAQKIRLGYSNFQRSMKSFGSLSGMIILRTIDKSEKLYNSMKSRGYSGQHIKVLCDVRFGKNDWVITVCLTVFLGIILLFSF